MKILKGTRYAEGARPEFVKYLAESLPYVSFDKAKRFYKTFVPRLTAKEIALLGANDRFYLLTAICRRVDAINEWVYDRCREVEMDPDERLDLWSRFFYKSTIITFVGVIQEIINDPEITIGIFSNTKSIARPFLRQIADELEKNVRLQRYYADVFWADPRKDSPLWSKDNGIIVRRSGNPKEATVEAHGLIDGLPTGRHFQLRIYDDIINEQSVTQTDTDQMGRAMLQWELSQSLGTHDVSRRQHLGTRYSFSDVYGLLLERRLLTPRIYPATHDGTLNGRPVFITQEKWDKIKRDQRRTVAAQMLLNPLAGEENTFMVDWLRPFEVRPRLLTVYLLVDPAMKQSDTSDRTAMIVLGMDTQSNFYLLDGYCHRMKLSEKTAKLIGLHKKWFGAPGVQMVRVGYERIGMQTDVEHIELEIMRDKVEGMNIEEVNWTRDGTRAKGARISRLEPSFRESRFWMPPYVWVAGVGKCTWKIQVRTEGRVVDGTVVFGADGKPIMDEIAGSAEIIYSPYKGKSRSELAAEADSETYRIMEPLRRLDEDNNVYDLTRIFFEEYSRHPFIAHEDVLDATSRVYDMDPTPPMLPERMAESEERMYPD